MNVLLEVNHLTKQYRDIKAVEDLSFSVMEGDIYGFLGQNGAGKSTTIRMLLTLISPTAGEIKIFGLPLHENRHEILSQTGSIIERPDLYQYLTAYENLSLFARMSKIKVSRKLLMNQLEMVGLAERSQSKVRTFSQGMKQRLGIAVALVHDPKLIILDEPTNGLDPQGIADMRNLILRLSRQMGKTVIVSSHLLSEIEVIASRMIVIHKGKKIAEGVVQEMLDPANTLVQVETANNMNALKWLQETRWATAVIQGRHLQLSMNREDIPQLIRYLGEKGTDIVAVQPRHSLEAYFLSLTNNDTHVEPFAN
ncbi:MAG: ABC transporter ATP-binding protein [Sphingobacteriales bacterium]|nr:ABC transporter ATP-binding protein [Sphingobacteriales bacterium]